MRKSLIALATAGILASGTAAADRLTVRVGVDDGRSFVAVQDADDDYRRWRDDGRPSSVDDRQARINARIEQGLQDGTLTRREARQLGRRLAYTEAKERAFEADGRLDRRERAELQRDLYDLSQRLRFERRDGERRY